MTGTSLREELRRSRRRRAVSIMPLTKLRRPHALPPGHIINTTAELPARRPSEATVLLSVDQLEEALTGSGGATGDAFLIALREALSGRRPPVGSGHAARRLHRHASATRCTAGTSCRRRQNRRHPHFSNGTAAARRLHAIIEGPAALSGLELEPGLASRIVDEARADDALPLLAFALRERWDRYGKKDL
jgi:hypothetical protein